MFEDFNQDDEITVPKMKAIGIEDNSFKPTGKNPASSKINSPINGQSRLPAPPPVQSAARERVRRRKVKQNQSEWAWVVIAVALFGVIIVAGVGFLLFLRISQQNTEIIPTVEIAGLLPTPIVARTEFGGGAGGGNLQVGDQLILDDGTAIDIKPWDGKSRFTMIMVGLDRRPGETGVAYRTDTMMIVSIDPESNSIGVLSVPRDLFVQVPGYASLQRVNTPMVLGEYRQPGYGPQLMMETVQLNLGIRVHDYVAVDFQAFISLVDAIGGVDIETTYNISDPSYPNMYYGYEAFYLPAGQHHLDGATALKFARTRHSDNDFGRAERQQQVIMAVRNRILSLDMIPSLIAQSPFLWNSMQENVFTGLSLEQIIQLGLYVKDVPGENIHMDVIDYTYSMPFTTSQGAQVLIPNRTRIGPLMLEIFGENYTH